MQVFIVNGNPRAGKDTFVDMVRAKLRPRNCAAAFFSSIDPVREALQFLGIDVLKKTERDRRLMADLGDALERHSSYKSQRCVDFVIDRRATHHAIFLYIREISVMRTVEAMLGDYAAHNWPILVNRVYVSRPEATAVTSNDADAGVNFIAYDIEIHNDAGLEQLEALAEHFAIEIIEGGMNQPDPQRVRRRRFHASARRPIQSKEAA